MLQLSALPRTQRLADCVISSLGKSMRGNCSCAGPSAAAQEPVATIPAEALPIAETVMRSLRSRSLAYMLQGVTFHGDGVLHHKVSAEHESFYNQ